MAQRHWQEVVTPPTKEQTDLFTTRDTEGRGDERQWRRMGGWKGGRESVPLLRRMRQVVRTEGPQLVGLMLKRVCSIVPQIQTAQLFFPAVDSVLPPVCQFRSGTQKLLGKIKWHPSPRRSSQYWGGLERFSSPSLHLFFPFSFLWTRQTIVVFYDPLVTQPHTYPQHVVRIVYKIKASFVCKVKPLLLSIYWLICMSSFWPVSTLLLLF